MTDKPPVAIIMGSQSDWATMKHAADTLDVLGVPHKAMIVSAHRTPDRMVAFAKGARADGFKVIIAGAGGAAAGVHGPRRAVGGGGRRAGCGGR